MTPAILPAIAARTKKWSKSKTLAISTLVLLIITAHGFLIAWGGVKLTNLSADWFPWIAAGALLAVALHSAVVGVGLHPVIRRIHSKANRHAHQIGGHVDDRGQAERGPHDGVLLNLGHGFVEIAVVETDVPPHFRLLFYDKHKQARAVPRNATVRIEIVRPDDTRQTFDFRAQAEYLESTTEIPEPHEFKAIVRVSHGSHTHTHEVQI